MSKAFNALEQKLFERIERDGPITFRDFMQAALYDAEHGYYSTSRLKIGAAGDYYTSSNLHSAFGATLSRAFIRLWTNSTEPLTVVEFGAGTGQLAQDFLSSMRDESPACFETVSYILIETSSHMRQLQRERLVDFCDCVSWLDIEDLERTPVTAIAFSNELIDALPVHCVRRHNNQIQELYVQNPRRKSGLALVWAEPSTDLLMKYIERCNVPLKEGQTVEINLDAIKWLRKVARALRRGFLVTIDYGDLAPELWKAERSRGTLRSFYRHRLIDSPLQHIGEQDITASVNFTALIEYGRDFGFELQSFERQSAFLTRMGLIERLAVEYGSIDTLDDLKERLAVKNLFVPGGISDSFRVLIQERSTTT
jgi:SAM-dependent MidA family methyltransferase